MLQYYPIMRANGPRALVRYKSSPLHQCNHKRIRVLGHVPIAPQELGDTDQNCWYCKTDHILNSCHNNSFLGLVENITKIVLYKGKKKMSIIQITYNLVFRFVAESHLFQHI